MDDQSSDIKQTQDYFVMIGLPQELSVTIGLCEVMGGILLVGGILTRIVAFLFAIKMVGAFIVLNVSHGIPIPKGYELALLYINTFFGNACISCIDRSW